MRSTWWPVLGVFLFSTIGGSLLYLNMDSFTFLEDENGKRAYLESSIVHPGDIVQACYPNIKWYEVHPAVATHWYECPKRDLKGKIQMVRFDLPLRTLRVPDKPQQLPPKCRPIGKDDDTPIPVPSWCEAGHLNYGGFITNTKFKLWNTIQELP